MILWESAALSTWLIWVSVSDFFLVVLHPPAVMVCAGGCGSSGRAGGEVQQGDHRAARPQRCATRAQAHLLGNHGIGRPTGIHALTRSRVLLRDSLRVYRSRMGSLCLVFVSVVWVLSFGCGCWTRPSFGPLFVVPYSRACQSRGTPLLSPNDEFTYARPAIYALEPARAVRQKAPFSRLPRLRLGLTPATSGLMSSSFLSGRMAGHASGRVGRGVGHG
jgi:hypothetical protein